MPFSKRHPQHSYPIATILACVLAVASSPASGVAGEPDASIQESDARQAGIPAARAAAGSFHLLDDGATADKVVAVVDQQPILLSELDLEVRVALISQGGTEAAAAKALGDDVLKDLLPLVIDQRLADKEAQRMQNIELSADERFAALDNFAMRLGGEAMFHAFLARHEASGQRVFAILERGLRVERFLANKIEMAATVSDADIQDYYDAHAEALGGKPLATVRKAIRDNLLREKVKEQTAQFFEGLRARAEIRILPPFVDDAAAYESSVPMETVQVAAKPDAEDEKAQGASDGK